MTEPFEPFGGHMRWFGESWGAPVCDPVAHIETPVGMLCSGHAHLHHERFERIKEEDQGIVVPYLGPEGLTTLAFHLDCWFHELGVPPSLL